MKKIIANTGGCGISVEPFRRARMEGDKLSGLGRYKSRIEDRGRDLFKKGKALEIGFVALGGWEDYE